MTSDTFAAAIHHEDNSVLEVTHVDDGQTIKLLDVFGNPQSWIESRYTLLDERWVQRGLGETLAYRDESQRSISAEPPEGWTPSESLRQWRNNVGPTSSMWPEDNPEFRPDSFGTDFTGPRYDDAAHATRRTAYWFNIERKWKACKCDTLTISPLCLCLCVLKRLPTFI